MKANEQKTLFVHLFPINLSLFTAFLDLERLKKFLEHRKYVLLIQDIYLMSKNFHVSHRLNLSKQDFIFDYTKFQSFLEKCDSEGCSTTIPSIGWTMLFF